MRSRALYLLAAMLIVPFAVWLAGCTDFDGEITANQPPEVEFVNVHADIDTVKVDNDGNPVEQDTLIYDYAPVIYWKGSDPDGFIEYYSFADIVDAAAVTDPISYIPRIPQEAWMDTISTQATIKLLSEIDDTTEHVFYLRAFDNDGAESDVKYRRFYRSNNPPVIPRIGLTGADEADFANRYVVADTLFSAPSVTNIYQGIQFSWRGSDPDDKALFTIPLEYQTILVKSPAETVFVNPWTDEIEVQLIDLETGFYTLNVWARDDGLTRSVAPARAEFNVIRPTFANNLLIVLESPFSSYNEVNNPPTRAKVRSFYEDLLDEVAPMITNTNLDPSDSVDVRFYSVESLAQAVPRSLISQYKLVIYAADHVAPASNWATYAPLKQAVEDDYLRVGGRVWQMGRCLTETGAYYGAGNVDGALILDSFFGIVGLAAPETDGAFTWWESPGPNGYPAMYAEFVGTIPGLPEFPALTLDTLKVDQDNGFAHPGSDPPQTSFHEGDWGQTGVIRIVRGDAETTQQFISRTYGQLIAVDEEDSYVLPTGDNTIDNQYAGVMYPATSTNAFIALKNDNVDAVFSIINQTFRDVENRDNYIGQPVYVNNSLVYISYDEGDPWSDSDSLQVSYTYNPISEVHLKPVEIRVEGTQGGNQFNPFIQLRYRTAFTGFSYYFMDNEGTVQSWVEMLEWLYNPNVNDAQFDL